MQPWLGLGVWGSFMAPVLMGLQTSRGSRAPFAEYSETKWCEQPRRLPGRRRSDLREWSIYARAGGRGAGVDGESPVLLRHPFLSEAFSDPTWKGVESQDQLVS